jgi:hypothetical protein
MANSINLFTRKLMKGVMESFESQRVISKTVNTALLKDAFGKGTGANVDFPRPTDYVSSRTSDGDISGGTASPIITGKATATVQDYITVEMDFQEADQAINMGGQSETDFYDKAAMRIVTDLEVDFAAFALKNTALLAGSPGTAVSTWAEVANAGALMRSSGVPMGGWSYVGNPFLQSSLADIQRSLGTADSLVSPAFQDATLSKSFAGFKVLTADALATVTTGVFADKAGTLTATPTATYLAAKDTMTQTLAVTAFTANGVVKAGEIIQVTGRNRLNLATRQPMLNAAGAQVLWTAVVTADVTLDGSGAGNLVCTGPAIRESGGAYNTVDSALTSGDVVTLLYPASAVTQANLFYHKDAFGIGSCPIDKLFSTDTIGTSKDGLQMRCSKGASIRENKQIVRFDLRPAYAALNPFFAGQGFGTP